MIGTLFRGLVLRWIARHRLRSALAVLAVALGVAAFLSSVAVARSVVATGAAATAAVHGGADLVVEAAETGLDPATAAKVRATSGVAAAAPMVADWVRVAGSPGRRVLLVGIDALAEASMRRRGVGADAIRGARIADPASFLLGTGAVLAEPAARELSLVAGGVLRLQGARGEVRLTVAGTVPVPGAGAGTFAGRIAVVPLPTARAVLGRGDRIDRVDVTLDDGADAGEVAERILAALGPEASSSLVVGPPGAGDPSAQEVLGAADVGLRIGAVVALLVGVFLIHHTVAVGVTERRREVGILRALGATRGQVLRVFCAEALVLGLVGSALGVALGFVLATTALAAFASTISGTYFPAEPAPVEVPWPLGAAGVAVGAIVALVAAWGPARRAAALPPDDAIRRGSEGSARGERPSRARVVAAAATAAVSGVLVLFPGSPTAGYASAFALLLSFLLAAPSLLVLGARIAAPLLARVGGIPGRLASDELLRHPGRSALPAAALGFGLALVLENLGVVSSLALGTTEWMESNVAGDVFVSSGQTVMRAGGHALLDASLSADLARVAGVEAVVGVRMTRPRWRDTRIMVLALDVGSYRRMAKLRVEAGGRDRDEVLAEVERGGACLVSENFSYLHDVAAGDTVDLPAAQGTVPLRVLGTFPDLTWPRGTVLVDRGVVATHFRDDTVDEFSLALARGVDPGEAATRIESALGEGCDVVVTSAADLRAAARQLLDDFFALAWAQVAAALAVAFLGVFNSLWMATVMRRRELGLFRAAGATRGQLVASIVLQAATLGAIGGVYGVVGGIAIEWMALRRVLLADTGWTTYFVIPWGACAAAVVLGIATSAFAGLFPARVAARTEIRDAIGYE